MAHKAFEIWSSQREKHWRQGIFIIVRFFQESLKDLNFGHIPCQTTKLRESVWMFEKEPPTFDVTSVFMLFRIIYAGRAALMFGNNKTSRQYCLEICKEIAVL